MRLSGPAGRLLYVGGGDEAEAGDFGILEAGIPASLSIKLSLGHYNLLYELKSELLKGTHIGEYHRGY